MITAMNTLRMQLLRHQEGFFRFYYNILKIQGLLPSTSTAYVTTFDVIDTGDNLLHHRNGIKHSISLNKFSILHSNETESKFDEITSLSDEEFEKEMEQLVYKSKDKLIEQIIVHCLSTRRLISDPLLKLLLKHYSNTGKPEMISLFQKYCAKLLPNSYRRNGEFNHYMAKAQCLKGNSEKGLSMLRESYRKNLNLRSFYRVIFRELIHDSVLNRSEASLVVFKKYVLEFSTHWEEHYPLVCFWHICWLSTWYSDQMLSNELWESSEILQEIVSEKVAALCISALRSDCNEDAVVRLLQTLLKYKMMQEYASVLQVLFSYKLRNKDLRGCAEIVRNCEVLGIILPSDQRGRYINMLIKGQPAEKPIKTKEFKLKF